MFGGDQTGTVARSISRIKLGPGVVGALSFVALGFFGVLGIAAYNLSSDWMILAIVCLASVVVLIFLAGMLWYANKHPDYAALASADVVKIKELTLGAKDPNIIDYHAANTTNDSAPEAIRPDAEPPKAIQHSGDMD